MAHTDIGCNEWQRNMKERWWNQRMKVWRNYNMCFINGDSPPLRLIVLRKTLVCMVQRYGKWALTTQIKPWVQDGAFRSGQTLQANSKQVGRVMADTLQLSEWTISNQLAGGKGAQFIYYAYSLTPDQDQDLCKCATGKRHISILFKSFQFTWSSGLSTVGAKQSTLSNPIQARVLSTDAPHTALLLLQLNVFRKKMAKRKTHATIHEH